RATTTFAASRSCDISELGTNNGSRYSRAQLGFAEADSPFGPFKLVNTTRANWGAYNGSNNPGMARDMTVFIDQKDANGDGVRDAYAVYSTENNAKMYVSRLDDTYTDTETRYNESAVGTTWQQRVLPDDS